MKPLINYMVLADSINRMYSEDIANSEYIKWFPIYLWVDLTYILPLRATEFMLTPRDCLSEKNGKVYITVRRTQKKKRRRKVAYDIS